MTDPLLVTEEHLDQQIIGIKLLVKNNDDNEWQLKNKQQHVVKKKCYMRNAALSP